MISGGNPVEKLLLKGFAVLVQIGMFVYSVWIFLDKIRIAEEKSDPFPPRYCKRRDAFSLKQE